MALRVCFDSLAFALSKSPFFIFEEGIGFWLGTNDDVLLGECVCFESFRFALHVPSEDKHGHKLSENLLAGFIQKASDLGLNNLSKARGYWTHEETKVLQEEAVTIVWTNEKLDESALLELARVLLIEANQDAVAVEFKGVIQHITSSSV